MAVAKQSERRIARFSLLIAAAVCLVVAISCAGTGADDGWQITSFAADYTINGDGSVVVVEDIRVDFNDLKKHGIYRVIPTTYAVSQGGRVIEISVRGVTNGVVAVPFSTSHPAGHLEIKIGDANRLVTGKQRYRIEYSVTGALNAFTDHDEFYWNVTGTGWGVPMERVSARVQAPSIGEVTCYQGAPGSQARCESTADGSVASFATTGPLPAGSGLTIVVSLAKGSVAVPSPTIVRTSTPVAGVNATSPPPEDGPDTFGTLDRLLGLNLPVIAASVLLGLVIAAALFRLWWMKGTDLWYGDRYLLNEEERPATRKPLFAHETIPVEFAPPEWPLRSTAQRPLRPAEMGVLLRERVSDIDVTATIVDLAVRKYLLIRELPKGGLLVLFDKWIQPRIPRRLIDHLPAALTRSRMQAIADYEIECLRKDDFKVAAGELLPYESLLFEYLFATSDSVRLSELKGNFAPSVAEVKDSLLTHAVRTLRLFTKDPEASRSMALTAGAVTVAVGIVGLVVGGAYGIALLAVPVVLGGAALIGLSDAMPRRTASGRELFRESLGFREYMVTAEADIQGFLEEKGLFSKYLPYAIVLGCTRRWAQVFEGIEFIPADASWYAGLTSFEPTNFVLNVDSFSRGSTGVLTFVPKETSGGSGFSGFMDILGDIAISGVGGGLGGGGGGSW